MIRQTATLEALEVVGYADRLGRAFVPQVVPPIFRKKTAPHYLIMPPFQLEARQVTYSIETTPADLDRAERQGQATRLDVPFAALPEHQLWIDESFVAHYQPTPTVLQTLRQLAETRVREAQSAIAEGRLGKAERLAQAAISADDTCLNAILVKGLLHRLRGDHDSVEMLGEIARSIAPGTDFESWIDFFAVLVMNRRQSRIYDSTPPSASMIGEPEAAYGEDGPGSPWEGAGGHVDLGEISAEEISKLALEQYEPLANLDLPEHPTLVM